jgi:hypothetical protein
MKNLQVIPTDNPSRLKQNKITKKYSLVTKGIDLTSYIPVNLCISNDEKPKVTDWVITPTNDIMQWTKVFQPIGKKIILMTDQKLIKDGVQAIDDEFLEWFVKNPSCEEVEIDYGFFTPSGRKVDPMGILQNHSKCVWKYKIIIPKKNFYCGDKFDYDEQCLEQCETCVDKKGVDYGYLPKEESKLIECYFTPKKDTSSATICDNCGEEKFLHNIGLGIKLSTYQEEPKQDLEKEMFELEKELDIPSSLRWHNSKPKQETLEEALYKYVKDSSHELYELRKQCFLDGYKLAQKRSYSEEEVLNFTQTILMQYKFGNKNIEQMDLLKETLKEFKNK